MQTSQKYRQSNITCFSFVYFMSFVQKCIEMNESFEYIFWKNHRKNVFVCRLHTSLCLHLNDVGL
jgi:hypothetical protein